MCQWWSREMQRSGSSWWWNTETQAFDNNDFSSDFSWEEAGSTTKSSTGPLGWCKRQAVCLRTNRWPALACLVLAGYLILFTSIAVHSLFFRSTDTTHQPQQEENHKWLTEFFARHWVRYVIISKNALTNISPLPLLSPFGLPSSFEALSSSFAFSHPT